MILSKKNKNVDLIVTDLIESDPSLEPYRNELRLMVQKIIERKPDTKFNKAFRTRLRSELMAKAKSMQKNTSPEDTISLTPFTFMKKFTYAFSGAVIAAIVIVPAFIFLAQSGNVPTLSDVQRLIALTDTVTITPVGSGAFGSLTPESQISPSGVPAFGGGGRGLAMAPSPMAAEGSFVTSEGQTTDAKMIAPAYNTYRYVYTGDSLNLPSGPQDVYKRISGAVTAPSAASILSKLSLGLINTSSFGNAKLQNVSITQDEPFGYNINTNFEEGMIQIYENFQRWPQISCSDPNCSNLRLSPEQVPNDDEAIKIAGDFIKAHGIPITNYGKPEVDSSWRVSYESATDKSLAWVPDAVSVIYPILIESQPVYEQGGMNKVGLMVTVNVRQKRVSAVYNLTTQKYESSRYDVATADRVLAVAERGGATVYYEQGGTQVDVEIGTPTRILTRVYHYDEKTSRSSELLVPALLFPVTKPPVDQPYFYQKFIIVPIVSELLKESQGGPINIMPVPEPRPMPLSDTGSGSAPGSTGSGEAQKTN